MAKKIDPLKVMNTMAGAAHQKAQPPMDNDEDDMAPKASSKKAAAINEKKKGNAKAPKLPKPA